MKFSTAAPNHVFKSFTGSSLNSPICLPPTFTYNACGRRRYPPQSGQVVRPRKRLSKTRYCTLYKFCSTSLKNASIPSTNSFPFHSVLYCSAVRSITGVCTGKLKWRAPFTNRSFHNPSFSPFQGATAPSYTLNNLFGITRSSSMPNTIEKPSQVGQAPSGLLNEKRFGTGSSN